MKNKERKLTKKDVAKASWRWMFFHHSAQNYERMTGTGFGHSLSGALEVLYKDDKKGLSEALKRNLTFFNTEPQLGAIIPGITLALEETYANNQDDFDPEIIASTKNALMGPIAGLGDSLLIGTINPIFLSIGIGLATNGSPVGPLVFLALWLGLVVPMKYYLFVKGYDLGMDAVKILMNEEIKTKLTTALTMIGLIVIGGVASSTIQAPIAAQFSSGDLVISLQEILDKIMPNLFPLIVALVSYYLAAKRGWSTNKLLLAILAFAAVMVTLGIM